MGKGVYIRQQPAGHKRTWKLFFDACVRAISSREAGVYPYHRQLKERKGGHLVNLGIELV